MRRAYLFFSTVLPIILFSFFGFVSAATFTTTNTTKIDCSSPADYLSDFCKDIGSNRAGVDAKYICTPDGSAVLSANKNGLTTNVSRKIENFESCKGDNEQKPLYVHDCEFKYLPRGFALDKAEKYDFSYEIYGIGVSKDDVKIPYPCEQLTKSDRDKGYILPVTIFSFGMKRTSLSGGSDPKLTSPRCAIPSLEDESKTKEYLGKIQKESPNNIEFNSNKKLLEERTKSKHITVALLIDCTEYFNASYVLSRSQNKESLDTLKKELEEVNDNMGDAKQDCFSKGGFLWLENKMTANSDECRTFNTKKISLEKKISDIEDEEGRYDREKKDGGSKTYVCTSAPADKKRSEYLKERSCEMVKSACKKIGKEISINCKTGSRVVESSTPGDDTEKKADCSKSDLKGSVEKDGKCVCKDGSEQIEVNSKQVCARPSSSDEKEKADLYCKNLLEGKKKCDQITPLISPDGTTICKCCNNGSCDGSQEKKCAFAPACGAGKELDKEKCQCVAKQSGPPADPCKSGAAFNANCNPQQQCVQNGGQWTGNYCLVRPPQDPNAGRKKGAEQCPQGQEMIQGKCFPKKPNAQQPQGQNKQQGGGQQQRPPMPPPYFNPYMNQMTQSPFLNALTGQYICGAFEVSDGYTGQSVALGNAFKVKWDIATATGARPSTVTLKVTPTAKIKYNQSQRTAEITPQKTGSHTVTIDMAQVQKGESCPDISVDVTKEVEETSYTEEVSETRESATPTASYPTPTRSTTTSVQRQSAYTGPVAESVSEATRAYDSGRVDTTRVATYQSTSENNNLCEVFSIGCPEGGGRSYQQVLVEESLRNPIAVSQETPTDVLIVGGSKQGGKDGDVAENTETHVTKAYFVDETGKGSEEVGFTASKTAETATNSYLSGFFGSSASDRVATSEETLVIDDKGQVFPVAVEEQGLLSRFWNWIKSWFIWG